MTDLTRADAPDSTAGATQARSARAVPTRRISFEESLVGLDHHFAGGDIVASHVLAALSSMFPDGEDFFVRSVRNHRDQISDPELRSQVNGFIGQEAMHGREHRQLNDRLAELGYPTKRYERIVDRGLRFRERVLPPIANLAATAALEHFTATLAELLMSDADARDRIGDERVRELLLWHALEEAEHKAVAFDVYRAVGGSERLRTMTMRITRVGFVLGLVAMVAFSIATDRAARRHPVRIVRSLRRQLASPWVSLDLWRQLGDYNRPDFHPDDRDTDGLLVEWRERLFGAQGTLNDRLVGRAA